MIPFLFETLVILLALFIPWYTLKAIRKITLFLLKFREFEIDETALRKFNFLRARPFRNVWTLSLVLISSFLIFGLVWHGHRKPEDTKKKLAVKKSFEEDMEKFNSKERRFDRGVLGIPTSPRF